MVFFFSIDPLSTTPGAHAASRRGLAQDAAANDTAAVDATPAAAADETTTTDPTVDASPAAALDGTLTQAELCAVAKALYRSNPAACAGVPEIKVKTVPVAVGDVDAPKELVVTPDGKIVAVGGVPAGGEPHRGLSKGAAAGVAVVVLAGVVAAVVVGVAIAKKKRNARRVMAK